MKIIVLTIALLIVTFFILSYDVYKENLDVLDPTRGNGAWPPSLYGDSTRAHKMYTQRQNLAQFMRHADGKNSLPPAIITDDL